MLMYCFVFFKVVVPAEKSCEGSDRVLLTFTIMRAALCEKVSSSVPVDDISLAKIQLLVFIYSGIQ